MVEEAEGTVVVVGTVVVGMAAAAAAAAAIETAIHATISPRADVAAAVRAASDMIRAVAVIAAAAAAAAAVVTGINCDIRAGFSSVTRDKLCCCICREGERPVGVTHGQCCSHDAVLLPGLLHNNKPTAVLTQKLTAGRVCASGNRSQYSNIHENRSHCFDIATKWSRPGVGDLHSNFHLLS